MNTTVRRRSMLATIEPTSASTKSTQKTIMPPSSTATASWAVVSAAASKTGICPKSGGRVTPSASARFCVAWST